ncbi:MAG: glycosyltransferase family 1 protein [Bacteroidota bacterium]
MRIAVNTRLLLANRLEGIGRFKHEVLRRLVERHPEHEFLFLFDRPFDQRFLYGANVKPLIVQPPSRHPVLWYLWFEWAIPRILRREKAELFLSMDNYCSLSTQVPTLMVTHDIAHAHYPEQVPLAARWYYQHFVPRYLRRADVLITVSDFCRKDINAQYGIDQDLIRVACNAAHPAFIPLSEDEKQRIKERYAGGQDYFFYLGALHPRKNIIGLMQAFDLFKAQSGAAVKLLIGGRFAWQSGGIREAYEQIMAKDDIEFLGYISDQDLPQLTAAALAQTYVSLFEGFGVPIIEAMQAGVPVITSNVSSMPEVVGDAALLVDPKSQQAIAAAMQRIYNEPGLRNQLIERGLVQAQKFSWDKATDTVEGALLALKSAG